MVERQKERNEQMATVITGGSITKARACTLSELDRIRCFLPPALWAEISRAALLEGADRIEEIRLRGGRRAYVTLGGDGGKKNLALSCSLSCEELAVVLDKMCDGSLYAYSESILRGFVSLGHGIRVGVCGRASVENGRILGVYSVTALNIRLPCGWAEIDHGLVKRIRGYLEAGEGVLVYSPPAGGKTTFLRSLTRRLASGTDAMRVSLVDSREELGAFFEGEELTVDILLGYPREIGVGIATAFMNPQVIVCDEIGNEREALAISEAQSCGVPLVASAHGSDIAAMMRREGIRRLHRDGAFAAYIGISIAPGMRFEYRITEREDVALGDFWDGLDLS